MNTETNVAVAAAARKLDQASRHLFNVAIKYDDRDACHAALVAAGAVVEFMGSRGLPDEAA